MKSSNDGEIAARPETGADAPAAGDATSGASIDKVRDILFGGHVREFERRFTRLEERLVKETTDLKEEMRIRLEALETYARKESESLAGQIKSEREERVHSDENASRELKEAAKSFERRATALDEQLSKSHRELRQQMLEQHQRLSEDIRKKTDDVLATLAREARELRADKADRAALASLLTEMAMRLTDEFHLPGAEDAGNG